MFAVMTTYAADSRTGDNVAWTLPNQFPAKAGGLFRHPAQDASRYYFVDMDKTFRLERGNPRFDGLFTSDLSGCQSGFLVRVRGIQIVRMVLYHQSTWFDIFDMALELFQRNDGPSAHQNLDRSFLLLVDYGSKPQTPEQFSNQHFDKVFRYKRVDGMVSFVLSFDGSAGEMSTAFDASRPEEKTAGYRGSRRQ